MFSQWISRFAAQSDSSETADTVDLARVCVVLLVEVARSDNDLTQEELDTMAAAVKSTSSLSTQEIDQLISSCLAEADQAISLHQHIRLINDTFSHEQKVQLMEQMWSVAYADGDLDRYEEYTIRKTSDLIYLKHRDFMQAKLRVLDRVNSA